MTPPTEDLAREFEQEFKPGRGETIMENKSLVRILGAVSAAGVSFSIFVAGYYFGLSNCKSFAEKLKDFLF